MSQHVATSNEMASIRTALSAERTLMAWGRTALSMIGFGFTFYKVMHALGSAHAESPRRFGIVLAAMGTVALLAGTIQHAHVLRSLGRRPGLAFYFACLGLVLGLLVIMGLALRMGPFS